MQQRLIPATCAIRIDSAIERTRFVALRSGANFVAPAVDFDPDPDPDPDPDFDFDFDFGRNLRCQCHAAYHHHPR